MQSEKAQIQEVGGDAAEDQRTNPTFQLVNKPGEEGGLNKEGGGVFNFFPRKRGGGLFEREELNREFMVIKTAHQRPTLISDCAQVHQLLIFDTYCSWYSVICEC